MIRKTARFRFAAALAVAVLGMSAPAAGPHPIHTTMTELVYQPSTKDVEVVIRAFVDDFTAAATGDQSGSLDSRTIARYMSGKFVLREPSGRPVALQVQGTHRSEDVIWIRLQGKAPNGLRGGSMRNELILELHPDQVNIVKVRSQGRERTLLFTRNARSKRLP